MLDTHNDLWFIDWEWETNRTEFYDIALFTLFSNFPTNGLAKFPELAANSNMLGEQYCDGVLIALHEIKNWLQVKDDFTAESLLKNTQVKLPESQ